MRTSSFRLGTLTALAIAACAAACGGGGGSSAPAAATPSAPVAPSAPAAPPAPPADIVSPRGNLQSVTGGTYTSNSVAQQAFDALNLARLGSGAGQLEQSTVIDVAAAAHASYLTTHITTTYDLHTEESNRAGFYEVTPASRIAKAGFNAGATTEAIGGTTGHGAGCVYFMLNTVYHAAALLSPFTKVGIGVGQDAIGAPLCVFNEARNAGDAIGQVPDNLSYVQYPSPGQTNVFETFYVNNEEPRPSTALFPNATAGAPVLVSLRNADWVNFQNAGTLNPVVSKFVLKDGSGNVVPSHILSSPGINGSGVTLNTDALLPEGFIVLVPQSPLLTNVFYYVELTARLRSGATPLDKAWFFGTRP